MSTQAIEFEVKKPNGTESLVIAPANPLSLLQEALVRGLSIEILERFQAMYERDQAMQARRAFTEAMAAFKSESITILRDRVNSQYTSRYVSLGNLVNTVTPFLSRHGLSARWDVDQSVPPLVKVTCIIEHSIGHAERVSMSCPPDTSGQKNPIQQIKSAITYAKVCTFESACGLASSDANLDDDGRSAGVAVNTKPGLSDERFVQLRDGVANAGDKGELERLYKAACKEAGDDQASMREFNKAKNQRYRELHSAGR